LPPNFQPQNSVQWRVQDGDDWSKIAAQCGMDVWKLIEFNYCTRDPAEVNYYLSRNAGCNKTTRDGANWIFSSSAVPGIIYVPARQASIPSAASFSVRLQVPHVPGAKNNSCWHDSARMLFQYKRRADINPLAQDGVWARDSGLAPGEFVRLARDLGLRPLPVPPASFDVRFLAEALTKYGPLWAAGDWNGGNHIIVITGADSDGGVWINDPAFARAQQWRNIAWFNEHIYRNEDVPNSILYLP
jgi:hypothetical protein